MVEGEEATTSYSKHRSNSIKSNFMIEVTEPRRLKNDFLKATNFKFNLLQFVTFRTITWRKIKIEIIY